MIYRRRVHESYKNHLPALAAALMRGMRPEWEEIDQSLAPSKRLKTLVEQCWNQNPNDRLPFIKVAEEIDEIILEDAIGDPKGKELWRTKFNGNAWAYWSDFKQAFEEYAIITNLETLDKEKMRRKFTGLNFLLDPLNTGFVTVERFGTILDWFGPIDSKQGFLNKMHNILSREWFFGELEQTRAETKLLSSHMRQVRENKINPYGSFLIRISDSTVRRSYTLSWEKQGIITHHRIIHKPSIETFFLLEAKRQRIFFFQS
eukprot:TRINITY_DN21998_c0_g1_i1.p1 TRINITY_DN21998_c0_g1~~TRINITY_DN21998_c0_g1_i1.p1  ORF type:complete len:260 (+),score=22.42 TRINITY_DN21998_c0_g1_i1:3-782(+)